MFDVKEIAIIGAGPAGLASARYLRHQNAFEHIVVYEQQAEVGGVWYYHPKPSQSLKVPQTSPLCPPDPPLRLRQGDKTPPVFATPMYQHLNTNIPHTLMNYSDLPFPKGSAIFPTREQVQSYLVEYSQPVRDLVRFCAQVVNVTLLSDDNGYDKWEVESRDTASGAPSRDTFDAVVVASGHYALPYIPDIPGISEFHTKHPGVISHSKAYRNPRPFAGRKAVVVGNAASGLDIARQLNAVCRKPLLISAKTPTPSPLLEFSGGHEVPEIEAFLPGDRPSVRFKDGCVEEVESVLFCTGYLFSFPFLDNRMIPLVNSGSRVHGLYRHLFHIQHPTLVFPGLLIKAVPFPLCEGQAAVFARVWSNSLALPLVCKMVEWENRELKQRGEAMHVLPEGGDIDYINGMHDWAMQSPGHGKEPPMWQAEQVWQRVNFKIAKLAFEKHGGQAKSLAEIGFVYKPDDSGKKTA